MAFSLHTLPVELVYRILDNLDNKTIFWSCQSVCTRLNDIINTYRPYQVTRTFTLHIHPFSNAPFFFSFCIRTSRFISHSDDHWARDVASIDPHDHIRSIIFYCSVWVQLLPPHRCHHLGKQQKLWLVTTKLDEICQQVCPNGEQNLLEHTRYTLKKNRCSAEPPKRFRRFIKASNWVQSLKKE